MEAELVAAATAMKESLFCRNMRMELGFTEGFRNVPVYINNISALHVAGNRTFSPTTSVAVSQRHLTYGIPSLAALLAYVTYSGHGPPEQVLRFAQNRLGLRYHPPSPLLSICSCGRNTRRGRLEFFQRSRIQKRHPDIRVCKQVSIARSWKRVTSRT